MAQINITLNQEEILQLLAEDSGNAFKKLLEESLNSILKTESSLQLNAEPYERTEKRLDSRNGVRERNLNTRIGTLTLKVPRHRNIPFKTMIFENYSRSEAALIAGMAEMVVNGVSTRKVTQVLETLCGTGVSKSAVSEVCKELDITVKEFSQRPLLEKYPFLTVDATYFKVRENHRVVSKAFMIAYGTNERGHREIIGFCIKDRETEETWKDFLLDLRKRGLTGMILVTSDAHEGLRNALNEVYPETPWQRCQFHFSKNIADKVPKKYQTGIRSELQDMFNSDTIKEARIKKNEIMESYSDISESAVRCLDEGFDDSMTVMELPKGMRRYFRTSNHIERLNKELKRRSKVIGIFPNTESLFRLMGSVLTERNEVLQNSKAIFRKLTYEPFINSGAIARLMSIAKKQGRVAA